MRSHQKEVWPKQTRVPRRLKLRDQWKIKTHKTYWIKSHIWLQWSRPRLGHAKPNSIPAPQKPNQTKPTCACHCEKAITFLMMILHYILNIYSCGFSLKCAVSQPEHGLSFPRQCVAELLVLKWNVLNVIKESEGTNKSNKEDFSQEEKLLWKTLFQSLI